VNIIHLSNESRPLRSMVMRGTNWNRIALAATLALAPTTTGCGGRLESGGGGGGAAAASPDAPTPTPSDAAPELPPDGGTQPTTLYTGGHPQGLALDSQNVYWSDTTTGVLMKTPKRGGVPTTLASGQSAPAGVAVRAGVVCWTNTGDGTVRRASADGGPVVTLASCQSHPFALTIVDGDVYFTTLDALMRVPLAGGAAVSLGWTGQGGLQGIASNGNLLMTGTSGSIFDVSSGAGVGFALCSEGFLNVAFAGPSAFWTTSNGVAAGTFDAAGRLGSTQGIWGSYPLLTEGIAADATHVYLATQDIDEGPGYPETGSILRFTHTGGALSSIATDQVHPVAVAVDDESVYWTNAGSDNPATDGSVMRAAK
jgi:hypothetical protein